MLKLISTHVPRAAAGRQGGRRLAALLRRRLLAAATVTATAAGLLSAPTATAALAATAAPAAATHAAATRTAESSPASVAQPAGAAPAAKAPALPAGQEQACGPVKPGYAACQSIVRTAGVTAHQGVFAAAGKTPSGYGPADLDSAYNLPSSGGAGQTVAVVDAYNDPDAESDLAVYRKQYGLPPCTTANGCFRKVAQNGSTRYPASDYGWSAEISLDLDMVSAICPDCHILLVEASDDSIQNLGTAVNEAVKLGAKYVSNSYGGPEDPDETSWDSEYFDHPGVAVVAASGDYGYESEEAGNTQYIQYPAASPYVTAVGGTTLTRDSGGARGWDESAWISSGSGCSADEAKPSWQTDTGCTQRTEADVAAVADPSTGVAVYDTYPGVDSTIGWNVIGGTSAATPIIASVYALAGTPLPGSTPASYPYADPSALNDITTGTTSGSCTSYLCKAGPGYDGPTGLGTPDGVAAFTLPHGDITGTVTSASGTPLAGAVVQAGAGSATTNSAGQYDLSVTPGSYTVSALDLSGYASQADTGVQVAAGQSLTENFTLSTAANVAVSGTVKDGSGQGWPVYAKVTLVGTTDTAYTNPYTGKYTLQVPQGGTYTVQADPLYGGYQQAQQTVTAATANLAASFAVKADPLTCSAAGYGQADDLSQPFSGDSEPAGWTVITNGAPDATWQFGQPDGYPNPIGNPLSGNYAAANYTQNDWNNDLSADTELISPSFDLSTDPQPVLQFDYSDLPSSTGAFGPDPDEASVDVSTDGGQTWTTVWSIAPLLEVGGTVTLPLPQLGGESSVQLRFHYTMPAAAWSGLPPTYWAIDDVTVSGCQPSAGGLVAGRVTDGNTGKGIAGATVTDGGQSVTTMAVPGNPGTGNGLYEFFTSQKGSQQVTASAPGYASAATDVKVAKGKLAKARLALAAGRLAVAPGSISASAAMGSSTTASGTVTNTGTLPVTVSASSQPAGYAPLGESAAKAAQAAGGAPLQRISGSFDPLLTPASANAGSETRTGAATAGASQPAQAPEPAASSWVSISSPNYLGAGMLVATDPVTGRVYAAGGAAPVDVTKSNQSVLSTAAVLSPKTGRWSALPKMPAARSNGQAAFLDGKFYVTGGYDNIGDAVSSMVAYNPATNQWSTAASPPDSFSDAAAAVLNGKMYVVGGCTVALCGETTVQVYNPASNTWTTAAPYPVATSDEACGTISGELYCAGGYNDLDGSTSAAYVYDPASNAWSPTTPLPIDLWGSTYAAANGQLLVSGGVTSNSTVVTNQGFAYDPATGAWSVLPNAPEANYYSSGACGFYAIGGLYAIGGADDSDYVEQLPGYGDCGGDTWLTASPSSTTIAPGQSATITVTLNAGDASITQPGTYTATLELGNDAPYGSLAVPVTLTANPPATWGQITGTVDGKTCSGTTTPVVGATVQVSGSDGNWLLTSDTSGDYGLWLAADNSPLLVIVTATGYVPQAASVTLKAGKTTTHNFTLTQTASCG